jgi:hypothetical protein
MTTWGSSSTRSLVDTRPEQTFASGRSSGPGRAQEGPCHVVVANHLLQGPLAFLFPSKRVGFWYKLYFFVVVGMPAIYCSITGILLVLPQSSHGQPETQLSHPESGHLVVRSILVMMQKPWCSMHLPTHGEGMLSKASAAANPPQRRFVNLLRDTSRLAARSSMVHSDIVCFPTHVVYRGR